MFRELWNRLLGQTRAETIEREAELEQMSPAERHFAEEGIGDIQADESVREHLAGIQPEHLSDDDQPGTP